MNTTFPVFIHQKGQLQMNKQINSCLLCKKNGKEMTVNVQYIHDKNLGFGEIEEIKYETGEAVVFVRWPDGKSGQYSPELLEFIPSTQE